MANIKLLVEGDDDKDFFRAYCQKIGRPNIDIFPPKRVDESTGDGWSNLVTNLPILLNQIKAGDINKLGIILDSDFPPENQGGFSSRYNLITKILQQAGYIIPSKANHGRGEIFSHSDGLPNVGLWIMPNHKDNGMFENFIEQIISSETKQQQLIQYAETCINKLPTTLFNPELRKAKAKIFTWRAWQARPGLPLNKALNDDILNVSKFSEFETWFKATFN